MSAASSDIPGPPRIPQEWGLSGGFALSMAALLGPLVLFGQLFSYMIATLPLTQNESYSVSRITFDLLTILAIFLCVRMYGQPLSKIGLGRFRLGAFLKATIIGFVLYYALVIVGMELLTLLFPSTGEEVQDLGYANLTPWEMALAFIALVVIVPVAEEMVFRGFMFTGLRRRLPFWLAALIVSILFGWVHGLWSVGVDVFFLSLVLCGLREYTTSLWPAIMLHATKNAIAFYLLYLYNGG